VDGSPRTTRTGLVLPPLGFGCWRFTDRDLARNEVLVRTAVEAGISLIDTADVYGLDYGGDGFGHAERLLGDVLSRDPSLRGEIQLVAKVGIDPGIPYDSSAAYLVSACEASLSRLRVEHVDLLLVHRPDMFTHPAEVAGALERIVSRGMARHVGVSNHSPSQTAALATHLGGRLAAIQPEFSALNLNAMRDGTLDQAMEVGLVPLAWSPLAGGRLVTGDGVPAALTAVLDELAEREGVTRATVAVAFVLAHPSRPVALVGTQRPERLGELARATSVRLDRRDVYRIVEASEGRRLP
jgi:predicted oxidoreductase